MKITFNVWGETLYEVRVATDNATAEVFGEEPHDCEVIVRESMSYRGDPKYIATVTAWDVPAPTTCANGS